MTGPWREQCWVSRVHFHPSLSLQGKPSCRLPAGRKPDFSCFCACSQIPKQPGGSSEHEHPCEVTSIFLLLLVPTQNALPTHFYQSDLAPWALSRQQANHTGCLHQEKEMRYVSIMQAIGIDISPRKIQKQQNQQVERSYISLIREIQTRTATGHHFSLKKVFLIFEKWRRRKITDTVQVESW